MGNNDFPNRQKIIACTVRKVLWGKTRDSHCIDDVCQDVSLICWEHDQQICNLPPERFERFIVRVTLNRYHSLIRKRKPLEWSEAFEERSRDEDPALAAEKTEFSRILLAWLNELPPPYREVARLRIIEGWSHERIAAEEGISANAVKIRFHRAKARLAKAVKRYFLN